MAATQITRRGFLASGAIIAGRLAFAAGPIALLAPAPCWALPLTRLDAHVGDTLLMVTRRMFPHATLEDAVYALVVKDLDAAAAHDAALATVLEDGVAELDAAAAGRWLDADSGRQLDMLTARQASPLFQRVRASAVVSLYDNDMAFAHFGYEGAAFAKGGYLGRGFNDLDWLPEPPAAASPAV